MIPILILFVLILILFKLCYKSRSQFTARDYRIAGANRIILAIFSTAIPTSLNYPPAYLLPLVLFISGIAFYFQAKSVK